MPRNSRVSDEELENDQLKDMLADGVNEDDNEQQDNEGTDNEQDGSNSDEQSGGDKEAQDGEQRDGERGRDNKDDSQQRGRNDQRQQVGQRQGDRNSQQQAQANNSVLQKLDEKTRNAVMSEAVNFVRSRTQPVFNKLEMDNRKLQQQLSVHMQASNEAKEYNLQPHERNYAYRMYAAFKKDGIATVKHLITELKKNGKNIDFGQEGGTSIDMNAIRGMIDEATRPMRGDFEQREQQQRARVEAAEQLTDFLASNPDAQIHSGVINGILQRYPNESLETAWLKVQNYALKNGLDITQPFDQQRQQQGDNQNNNNRRPLSLRGNRNVAQQNQNNNGEVVFANPNARWGDIILQEMKNAGYNLNR